MNFVRTGRRIDAIKQLREETGLGLKEAKQIIDHEVRNYRAANPNYDMQPSHSLWPIIFAIALGVAGYFLFFQG